MSRQREKIPYFIAHEIAPGRWRASTDRGYISAESEEGARRIYDLAEKVHREEGIHAPEVLAERLRGQIRRLDTEVQRLREEEAFIRQQIDEIVLKSRPIYPTEGHRTGIVEAVRRIRAREVPSSHHGDSCAPSSKVPYDGQTFDTAYDVVANGKRGFLSVEHRAPFSASRMGSRLWSFTDEEVAEILALVEAEGLAVTNHWSHDRGLSVEGYPKEG